MTKWKTLVTAAALVTAPGLALAEGCNWMKDRTAQITCAPGTTFDAGTGTCVTTPTG
ncbi:adenylosuccinate lyase [Jannaschia aquimarina]|uniref:Chitin-binding type-2 domain-containing protein n=1 Tax=Jannaschia aquimarina TaxID=935700 RepID=A0A0D1EJN1_9RHOB|nr:adenylosuccinate lyase [Jannaschia aquimarina]KIT17784.1 hypothetical protein jaqu_04430 [Jannaschia aquimarina]SNT14391.1 hypothetical protein SAMN05421775_106173 [Jannaschia aquimarina]